MTSTARRCALPLSAALLALLSLLSVLAPAASATPQRGGRPAILSPREGARVTSSAFVVRVRVGSASGFTALLNGRDVSRRFGRTAGGVRSARFVRGRDFRAGEQHLLVAVGRRGRRARRTASTAFRALRRDDRGLAIGRSGRIADRAALHVRVVDGRRRAPHATRVWLNGRRVETRLGLTGDRRGLEGPLGGDDGLRYGRNRVVAEVERHDGTLAQRTRVFAVSRRAPLVAAGAGRRTSAGRSVVLDGSRTRPRRAGERVAFRWRITAKPRGSRARLRDPGARRPRLRTDRPGRYRVELVARAAGSGRARAADTAAAAAATASDEVEVVATPTVSPMGIPIQTMTSDGGIQIGGAHYGKSGNWVQMLVLDPATAQPWSGPWGAGVQSFAADQGGALVAALQQTTASELVILSGQGNQVGNGLDGNAATQAFALLGGTLSRSGATPNGVGDLWNGQWTLIGHVGLAAGHAQQNYGVTPPGMPAFLDGSPGLPGTLTGYLQTVVNDAYQFVSPEQVRLDTAADGSSDTQNVIQVGSTSYRSDPIAQGALGFHLLVLRPGGLQGYAENTLVVNNADGSTNEDGVRTLAAYLRNWNGDPQSQLLILQSFGTPRYWGTSPSSTAWLKDMLPDYSGNLDWFGGTIPQDRASLAGIWNGTGPTVAGQVGLLAGRAGHDLVANYGRDYGHMGGISLVAPTHAYDPGAAVVQGQTDPIPSQARVIGTLTRNAQSQWTLRSPTADPDLDSSSMWQLAFQQPTAWPLASTPGQRAANAWIAGALFPGAQLGDVRTAYVSQGDVDWASTADQLARLSFPGAGYGFSQQDFTALQGQLETELLDVANVRTAVANWKQVFMNSAFTGYVDLQSIADGIVDQVLQANSQRGTQTSLDSLSIISTALYVGQAMVDFSGGPAAEFAAAPMGAIAGSLGLADALTKHDDGSSQPNTQQIWDEAYRLGQDLVDRHEAMASTLDHLGDLFVGDWGKLQQAAQAANGSWAMSSATQNAIQQAFSVTAKRAFYTALMPLAYNQWAISPRYTSINQQGVPSPPRTYQCYHANDTNYDGFENPYVSDPAGNLQTVGFRVGGDPDPAVRLTSPWIGLVLRAQQDDTKLQKTYEGSGYGSTVNMARDGAPPPAATINPLFQQVTATDLPSDPVSLGMDPERFLGSGRWTVRKLQCGGNYNP
ncbi:hypothetical protein [Conexibacter woesei]|uniref:Uncharacterized protein n=1 Tax=Conexibacter woesei (strain DSM 14684 / CCUG 47730 / CIP 108061 / JCM 11494 / NBRC 100937 / ID131577) TaxID=469383 RepID=D3EYY6_CONWI|nr:hypothetical protein [Conexibacter woesei]ADB49860.1 hypothetical protein Cwoe_1432 [Conexibacter woesei DSM 14684]